MSSDQGDEMFDFYEKYYAAIASSKANAAFCEQLFGKDMGQHGFAEVSHIDDLIAKAKIAPASQVLDLGCGNGKIAEYIYDCTGASVTGIDYVPQAIEQAQKRTPHKRDRLQFRVMDMANLSFSPGSFDVLVSIDTLYFTPLGDTLTALTKILKPGGQMAIFYSYGWEPWKPIEEFDMASLHPDRTDLAVELQKQGLSYRTWDYSEQDADHARRKQKICEQLQSRFEAEGNLLLFNNHMDEAKGIQKAYAAGAQVRFLYLVEKE